MARIEFCIEAVREESLFSLLKRIYPLAAGNEKYIQQISIHSIFSSGFTQRATFSQLFSQNISKHYEF